MNKKILFTIIPKGYWIMLLVVMILFITGYVGLANIVFNLLLFLIGLKLAVLIHEFGHLLFAKFVGGTPRRLILGNGHKVAETKFKGVKLILNSNFNSGLAYAAFNNLSFIRTKLLVFTLGGLLANFLIAALLILLFGFTTDTSEGIHLSSAICIANVLSGVSVLIPYYSSYQGIRLYSDGLSILRIPFHKNSQLVEISSVNELLDAFDLFESKKYIEAIAVYENFQLKTEGSKNVNINLSMAYLKLGNYERAIELMEELLPLIDEKPFKRLKNLIYNNLAWVYLLLNRIEEADKYSRLAYQVNPKYENVRGTRASVLIEKGKFAEGKNLLINDVDFNFPNSQTLGAAIYLSLAFHELEDHKKAEKYLQFVEDNLNILDIDEKTLYCRVKEKMAIHNCTLENIGQAIVEQTL